VSAAEIGTVLAGGIILWVVATMIVGAAALLAIIMALTRR